MTTTSTSRPRKNYDTVPYPGHPYAQTHPAFLSVLAVLFGMTPPPVAQCRVLELGCGNGANLIPMGDQLPGSTFVGIDTARAQIAAGQATIAALGLGNITLRHQDIMDADFQGDTAPFDYVIAHGVYSWISAEVQERILALCREHLAPNGVAYLSYNTYPGWHMLTMVREMMRYHTWDCDDPVEQVAKALAFLDFMSASVPPEQQAYGNLLRVYGDFLKRKCAQDEAWGHAFVLHDELAEINTPLSFSQFVERAASHGLQYLAETDLPGMLLSNLPPQVAATLSTMAKHQPLVDTEQYLDFLRGRTFRETLLCRTTVRLDRALSPRRLASLFIASPTCPASSSPDLSSAASETFRLPSGEGIGLGHPLSKAAMVHLAAIWPRAISFPDLVAAARLRLELESSPYGAPTAPVGDTPRDEQILAANLLKMATCSTRLLKLSTHPPAIAPTLSHWNFPTARPLARLQSREQTWVTNLLHERVRLDERQRALLQHLDGTRDRAALLAALGAGWSLEDLEREVRWLEHRALLVG
ncbi:MAG: methyltransferase [Chloroflexaceae bacterium]|nr:methyltransferase [Chloroflexaceae bacterium]